jgi:hypothetical protein
LNVNFRIALWHFFPPYPSFSLTWLFSFASLYLFYRLICTLTGSRSTALAITAIYMISVGFMSGVAMALHVAKPMVCFFIIAALYLTARLLKERGVSPANYGLQNLLLLTLFLAFLTDEIAWVLYPIIAIFGGPLFLLANTAGQPFFNRVDKDFAIRFLALVPVMVVFLTFIAPAGSAIFFPKNLDFNF